MSVTLAQYEKRLRSVRVQDAVAKELRATGASAQSAARSLAPRRTGALIRSIAPQVSLGDTARLDLGSPLSYAAAQERRHGFLATGLARGSSDLPERLHERIRALVVACGK